jgi:hypothetical protein
MESSPGSLPGFTAIWQSQAAGTDWPLYRWLMRVFSPYISEHITDGKCEVVRDNAILFDRFVYAKNPEYYKRFKGKNAFLVHISDEFYELGADRYKNFRGVFRMLWSSVFNPEHVMVFPLGTYIQEPPAQVLPANERRYAWSFIGAADKTSRPEAMRAFASLEPHFLFSSTQLPGFNLTGGASKRLSRAEFYDVLGQSIFAPSPMGNASMESCRPYDALEMGAIPIVERRLTVDYYKEFLGDHPLPTVSSWREGRRLADDLLEKPAQLLQLQRSCTQWWTDYQRKLIANVGRFLAQRSNATDDLVPLRSRLPEYSFWKYLELIRHHSAMALYRRFTLQASRLLKREKWRVSPASGFNGDENH